MKEWRRYWGNEIGGRRRGRWQGEGTRVYSDWLQRCGTLLHRQLFVRKVPSPNWTHIEADAKLFSRDGLEIVDVDTPFAQSRFGMGWDEFADQIWA